MDICMANVVAKQYGFGGWKMRQFSEVYFPKRTKGLIPTNGRVYESRSDRASGPHKQVFVCGVTKRRWPVRQDSRGKERQGAGSYTRAMDRLWTPWRYSYVTRSDPRARSGVPEALSAWPPGGREGEDRHCVFCNMIAAVEYAIDEGMAREAAERAALIVYRGTSCFVCLNAFPYSTGHVLIVPYRHVDSLAALAVEAAHEVIELAGRAEVALREVYLPGGINMGLNLGEAAGAGIADHIHLHALPRWSGDTNFMTVTAETRVLPEPLDVTWERLRTVFGN